MPYNAKADIHQWTWYRRDNGKFYVCTYAGWQEDPANPGTYRPINIELLEFQTTEPKPIALATMEQLLTDGTLTVIKRPY